LDEVIADTRERSVQLASILLMMRQFTHFRFP
jgi:hypothetical protein